jgi:hypothetical protein
MDILPPPGPDQTREEIGYLLALQRNEQLRRNRLPDIMQEANLDISELTRPIGIEDIGGFGATEQLLLTALEITSYVGLIYKDKFGRIRPNQFDTRIRPLLPVPAHSSYPSNHTSQTFSAAYLFAEILPEHPASEELFRVARRVAENREIAGLHYPSDTAVGKDMARKFLPFLVHACKELMLEAQSEWM